MAVREIRIWPDPALVEIAKPVTEVTDDVRQLVDDLFETMYEANGVGLAATQVAVAQRVLVIDLDPHQDAKDEPEVQAELDAWGYTGPQVFINPEIIASEGKIVWEEGCLSVPGYVDKVTRKRDVTVKALDRDGKEFTISVTGLYAVAIQHEMDHLVGKVFVEYLSKLKRDVVKRKMTKLKANGTSDGVAAAASL